MFDVSGRTWFSSQGPSPVFMDNQQNGSRVTARLGDEVSAENSVLHSHWLRIDDVLLSLVEFFTVLLRQLFYAIENHFKAPPTRSISCF